MTWVRLDDSAPDHPKHLRAGPEACWLWARGLAYSNRLHTDGKLSKDVFGAVVGGVWSAKKAAALAARLCDVGLWHDLGEHYQIHDYEHYQGEATKEEADARRERKQGDSAEKRDQNGWLYFVRVGVRVKIGFSKNPWARLEALRKSTPEGKVELLCRVHATLEQQQAVHRYFARIRLGGEWFGAADELLALIESVAAHGALPGYVHGGSDYRSDDGSSTGSDDGSSLPVVATDRAAARAGERVPSRPVPVEEEAAAADQNHLEAKSGEVPLAPPLAPGELSREWHAAIQARGLLALSHPLELWEGMFQLTCTAIMRTLPAANWRLAARAVSRYFWLAPSGPVAGGRVDPWKATPKTLARNIASDLRAANAWWAEQSEGDDRDSRETPEAAEAASP